jgi:hypothetical protein
LTAELLTRGHLAASDLPHFVNLCDPRTNANFVTKFDVSYVSRAGVFEIFVPKFEPNTINCSKLKLT